MDGKGILPGPERNYNSYQCDIHVHATQGAELIDLPKLVQVDAYSLTGY